MMMLKNDHYLFSCNFFVEAKGSQYRGVKELHVAPELVIIQQYLFILQLYTETVWKSGQLPGKKKMQLYVSVIHRYTTFWLINTFCTYHIHMSTKCVISYSD